MTAIETFPGTGKAQNAPAILFRRVQATGPSDGSLPAFSLPGPLHRAAALSI